MYFAFRHICILLYREEFVNKIVKKLLMMSIDYLSAPLPKGGQKAARPSGDSGTHYLTLFGNNRHHGSFLL